MITSKLTTKAQTTVPQPVRAALGLKAGDLLWYELVPVASVVRTAKIATFEARDAHRLGRITAGPMRVIGRHLAAALG